MRRAPAPATGGRPRPRSRDRARAPHRARADRWASGEGTGRAQRRPQAASRRVNGASAAGHTKAAAGALHPSPAGELAGHDLAAHHGQDPVERRGVGWVRVGEPPSQGAAHQRQGRDGEHPGIGDVEPAGQLVEQVGVLGQQRRLGGPAARPRRARRASSSSGSSSWRTRLRRWTGSRLLGSSTGVSPASTQRARVSARRRPRIGWRSGRMPARPSRPAPRSRLSSTVSAWSSAVWPVSDVGREHPEAGRPGPGLEVRTRLDLHPLGPEARHRSGPRPLPPPRLRPPSPPAGRGRRAPRSTRQPAAQARTSRARESAPPDTAHVTAVGAGGKVHRARSAPTRLERTSPGEASPTAVTPRRASWAGRHGPATARAA